MKLVLLVFALAVPTQAAQVTPECLEQFTMLAPGDGDPIPASVRTYQKLLSSLGGKISSETLRKMAEGHDPFEVPEQPGTDLFSLRKRLKEFKELLDKKEWNTPEVKRSLLEQLTSRVASVQEQSARTGQRLSEAWSDFQMKINDFANPAHVVSHDGRYVAIFNIPEDFFVRPGGIEMMITDRVTRKTLRYPVPEFTDLHGRFTFDPSGSHLYFFSEKQIITAVPMENGVPQWDRRESFDKGVLGGPLKMPPPGENPRYVFSENKSALQRVNLVTKEITKVELTEQMGIGPPMKVVRVGSAGNTDSIYAVATNENGWGGKVIVVDFDSSGKPLPSRTVAKWNSLQAFKDLTWATDGRLITQLGDSFVFWPTPDDSRSAGYSSFGLGIKRADHMEPPPRKIAIALHPKGAAILYSHGIRESWIEYVEFGNHEPPKLFRINDGAQAIHFSPDGEVLITKNGSQAHFINYKRRLLDIDP